MPIRSRTSPRKIPQQRRARTTVDAIVTAAAHLLAARGWAAATTNHIAERAGTSIGSLYKYFPNKPAILAEVARRRIAGEVTSIAAALATPMPPAVALAALVEDMAARYRANAALDTALLEQLGSIEVAPFLRAAEAEVVEKTAAYFARHAAVLRVQGPHAAFVVVHMLRGIFVAAAAHAPAQLGEPGFRRAVGEMLMRYLLA